MSLPLSKALRKDQFVNKGTSKDIGPGSYNTYQSFTTKYPADMPSIVPWRNGNTCEHPDKYISIAHHSFRNSKI